MAKVKHIQVNELPAQLEANAIYFVRDTGEIWQTDSDGIGVNMNTDTIQFGFFGYGYFSNNYVVPAYDFSGRASRHAGISATSDLDALAQSLGRFIPGTGYRLHKLYGQMRDGVTDYNDVVIGKKYIDKNGNTITELIKVVTVQFIRFGMWEVDIQDDTIYNEGDLLVIAIRWGKGTSMHKGLNIEIVLKK